MLITIKVTAMVMAGTFVIGMVVALITYELGALFTYMSAHKDKHKKQLTK